MSANHALARARELEHRLCAAAIPLPRTAVDVWEQLKAGLLRGARDERVLTPARQIGEMVKLKPEGELRKNPSFAILGGQKDFTRLSEDGWFKRNDGGLFNFTVTLIEHSGRGLELLAYDFELRLPEGTSPRFVRFDLNTPWHENSQAGLRSHFHPGHDDLQAPSGMMAPLELLDLFIYGMRLPDRERA